MKTAGSSGRLACVLQLFLLLLVCSIRLTWCLSRTELYPFGSIRDQHLNSDVDDISSLEVQLTVPITFYGTSYDTVFVNDNGLLSFLTEVPSFFNAQFPLSYPIISPLYSDVDTRGTGRIYYRETQAGDLLDRASSDIRKHFSRAGNFQAQGLFIATWDAVGAFDRKVGLVNTFQVVIASNNEDSYAIFLYPEGGIQWIQGQGKNPNLADARAQAGFMPGDGRLFTVRGSGTDQTKNLDRMSNIRQPGVWMFHIGKTGPGGNVLPADLVEEDDEVGYPQSCASAQVPCPPTASCIDHHQGFCCKCKDEYYGNGRSCIEKDKPHRMNGKVNGVLNDVRLDNVDLHAYIVTNDGRTYTAIRRIPPSIGYDFQALITLGGVIGWLFALPRSGAANGFTVTGGAFNRTTEVDFPGTGHQVQIQEEFMVPDVFNYMRVNVQLRGSLPTIPSDMKIEVDDQEEEFTRAAPGHLRSRSNKSYRLEGNSLEVPFVVDQSIHYEEHCDMEQLEQQQQHQQVEGSASTQTLRLKLARNFVTYEQAEEIVRFASTSKISPLNSEDPCKEGRHQCGQHSRCLAEGDSFRCVCDRGYEHLFQQDSDGHTSTCVDVNECQVGKDNCHVNAECVNLPGGFNCRCLQGYSGDGRQCQRTRTCEDLSCDLNAECVQEAGQPSCRCRPGYQGDGYVCTQNDPSSDDCRQVDFCDAHADCEYSAATRGYHCRCQTGFQGDGLVCLQNDPCDNANDCHQNARCYFDEVADSHRCVCNSGYEGDGYVCTEQDVSSQSCNVLNNCHPWAQCVYNAELEQYGCRCQAGYTGDGRRCTKNDAASCNEVNVCSLFGKCQADPNSGRYTCICNDGYKGDGITCDPVDECNTVENCDDNAQCIFDSVGQRYRCRCNTGFTGSGKSCAPEGGASCHIVDVCNKNAQCIYDTVDLQYRCQCLPGYEGDGQYCQPKVVSCNVLNNCHVYAECSYDAESRGHRCRCRDGYEGDGHYCRLVTSCNEDPFLCDVHADCVPSSSGHHCQCNEGYSGDGLICSVAPQHSGDFLLFAHGMSLLRMPFTTGKKEQGRLLLMEPQQTAVGVDVDCLKGNVYWTDLSHKAIRRAAYNGSNAEIVFDHGLKSPEGIAVDWASRNLYWADSEKDTIEVLRLETLDHKVLFQEGLVNPRGVALHSGLGKLYWSDWDRSNPKIESSNLDGSERSVFVADNLGLPNMITVDYERNALCWTDAGLHRLECINLNGQQRRMVYTPAAYPFGITVAGGYLYWTDWDSQFIQRVDRNGGNAEPIEVPLGGNGKLYGVTTVPSQCPRVRNPCAVQNGGCRHLCLPNGRGGRTCACPDDEDAEACNAI